MTNALHDIAKKAAEAAGRNARTAPQLLFAPILWALEDAVRDGALNVRPPEAAQTTPSGFDAEATRIAR